MGQDPIKNPLFDPGGKETDGNAENKKEKKSKRKRGTRGKGRAVHSEEQSKEPITDEKKGKVSKVPLDLASTPLMTNLDQGPELNQIQKECIHKVNVVPLQKLLKSRPPKRPDRQTIIDHELRRIRQIERDQLPKRAPPPKTKKSKKVRRRSQSKAADSNRNLTKDEEFILEHVTAFVFRSLNNSRAPPLDESAQNRKFSKTEFNAIEKTLQMEQHIKRVVKNRRWCDTKDAMYHCAICLCRLENLEQAVQHSKQRSHKSIRKQQNDLESLLHLRRKLEINPDRIAVLNAEINETLRRIKHDPDAELRRRVFESVRAALQSAIPECSAKLYGSSLTKTHLPSSDINIVIYLEGSRPNILLSRALAELERIASSSDEFESVSEHFYSSSNNNVSFTPNVKVVDAATGMKVTIIAADNEHTPRIKTANLIKFYLDFEPKMCDLALLFRQWGSWCALDSPEHGSIPAYAFTLCVIYFFQQQKWCPVLHQLTECRSNRLPIVQRDSKWFYNPKREKVSVSSALDDASISLDAEEMSEVITEESESVENPSGEMATQEAESSDSEEVTEVDDETEIELISTLPSDLSLADILIQFFEFFAFTFEMEDKVVSIRSPDRMSRGQKGWGSRRIAIEDPYQLKRNICRSLNSQLIFEYFRTRMRATLLRFRTGPNELRQIVHANEEFERRARSKDDRHQLEIKDPLRSKKPISESDDNDKGLKNVFVENAKDLKDDEERKHERILSKARSELKNLQIAEARPKLQLNSKLLDSINSYLKAETDNSRASPPKDETSERNDETQSDESEPSSSLTMSNSESDETDSDGEGQLSDTDQKWMHRMSVKTENVIKQLQVVFDEENISGGLVPMKVCQLCKQDGHDQQDCPDDPNKVDLISIPELSDEQYAILDQVLEKIYLTNCPTPFEVSHREHALEQLQSFMVANFDPSCVLKLFGSSRNGFGFKGSDMDLCLTFANHDEEPPPQFSNAVLVIKQLADVLKKNDAFRNVIAITQAKVPIVKFEYFFREKLYEGDISYYNVLAQRNTQLLSLYANLDDRCQKLGYVLKVMVKECGVGDASRGSLSSYAYVLLLIHYLQQVGVLPVLQELYDETEQPTHNVEGFNTWFQHDGEVIERRFERSNKDSLSRIWIGLLQYYTEDFEFDKMTIQIRQKAQMTTFEKEWTSKCISIEDPFELTHNLGCGVSRKMANYIVKVFQRARGVFGRFECGIFEENYWEFNLGIYAQALFSAQLLTDGDEVPNDRCCRVCGKIGHFVKDCPNNRHRKKKNGQAGEHTGVMVTAQRLQRLQQICYACKQPGHISKMCPNRQQRRNNRYEHEQPSPNRRVVMNEEYRRSPRNQRRDWAMERRMNHQANMPHGGIQIVHTPNGMAPPPNVQNQRKLYFNHGSPGNRDRLNSDTRKDHQNRPPMRPRTKTD